MTTTEYAAEIRAALKHRHGWTGRQVSIRAEHYSLGSSIHVTVKDPAIPLPTVKAVAECAESIRRCEITHEILGGGNRYVWVRYSHEALTIIGRRYTDAVQRAVDQVEPGSNNLVRVEGTEFLVGRPNAGLITLWDDDNSGRLSGGYSVEQVAENIGCLTVARQDGR